MMRKSVCQIYGSICGILEHADAQIGKVVDYLKEIGEFENTVIVLLSDNGASAEGGKTAG